MRGRRSGGQGGRRGGGGGGERVVESLHVSGPFSQSALICSN